MCPSYMHRSNSPLQPHHHQQPLPNLLPAHFLGQSFLEPPKAAHLHHWWFHWIWWHQDIITCQAAMENHGLDWVCGLDGLSNGYCWWYSWLQNDLGWDVSCNALNFAIDFRIFPVMLMIWCSLHQENGMGPYGTGVSVLLSWWSLQMAMLSRDMTWKWSPFEASHPFHQKVKAQKDPEGLSCSSGTNS